MDDHQTDTSKYSAAIADMPEFGRSLLVGAVEFSHSGMWITEHFALPAGELPIRGCSVRTHFNVMSIPADILPRPDDELRQAMSLAEAALGQVLFERDREAMRFLRPISQHVQRELTPNELAIIYLQREFTNGLQALRDTTECEALSTFLSDVFRPPKFAVQRDQRPK